MRLYTMASDRMTEYFARFLRHREAFLADVPLHVIPFDDDQQAIRDLAARYSGVSLVQPDERIDAIGTKLFEAEDYRPGVPAWRYLRKLNALIGHDEPFLFLDANTMLLCDPRRVLNFQLIDQDTIWFRSLSAYTRTINNQVASDFLEILNPNCNCGIGYNCGFFAAKGSFLDIRVASAMANRNLRHFIGVAPEQGFLAFYIGYLGKSPVFVQNVSLDVGARQDDQTPLVDSGDGYLRYADGPHQGRICLSIKQTGQDLVRAPDVIFEFMRDRDLNPDDVCQAT